MIKKHLMIRGKKRKKIYKYIIIILLYLIINIMIRKKLKKIGIIGMKHSQNIGNNLLKYAIYIKLSEFGFEPFIIGKKQKNSNISFILNAVRVRLINKSFNEIKENDYDILVVNSDLTWTKQEDFYNIAFLNFSKDWNITKFVYGASLGDKNWKFTKEEDKIIKPLIKNFNGISVRENCSIKLIESHLGFKPELVLDPTFLIDKKYYLNLIKNFKVVNTIEKSFIFIYTLTHSKEFKMLIKNIVEKYNYKIYLIDTKVINQIQKFIYGIYKSKAVITDSYHGTVFSIIFNKPFISFVDKKRGYERFNNLKEIFNINNRIYFQNSSPNINLLEIPLKINKKNLKTLKKKSIHFLKANLFFS